MSELMEKYNELARSLMRVDTQEWNLHACLIDASGSTSAEVNGKTIYQRSVEAVINALGGLKTGRGSLRMAHALLVSIRVFRCDEVIPVVENVPLSSLDLEVLKKQLLSVHPMGLTPMGKALHQTLTDLSVLRRTLVANGHRVGYPVIAIATDGMVTDLDVFGQACEIVDRLFTENARHPHLTLIPVGIGDEKEFGHLVRLMEKSPTPGVTGLISNPADETAFLNYSQFIQQTVRAVVAREKGPSMPEKLRGDRTTDEKAAKEAKSAAGWESYSADLARRIRESAVNPMAGHGQHS